MEVIDEEDEFNYLNKSGAKTEMDAEKQSISSDSRKQIILQVLFALIANIANISPGMNLGFSAVALPQLQNQNATFHINEEQASWIASLASISTPVGCLLTSAILDRFGRRMTLISLNLPCLLGWLLIAFADGSSALELIYAGRIFTGLATGMGSAPATVYSVEMCTDSVRGYFVTWTSIAISLGILFVYILGYILQDNWRLVAGISAIFPVVAMILSFFVLPESPSWLLTKGRSDEALASFKRMRGVKKSETLNPALQSEYDRLTRKLPSKETEEAEGKKPKLKIMRRGVIKPFVIMNLFFFFQQFAGIFVVILYAVDVVLEAGVNWDPYLVTILIGVTRVVVTMFMSFISNRYGRRPPSIVSGAGMTLCMSALAIFLYLQETGKISEDTALSLGWIPVTSLVLYILTSTIGFLTLPWAMIGEVYPLDVRGPAAGLTTCFAYIFSFIIVKFYPTMLQSLTKYGVFFFYGAVSLFGTAFVYYFLPETKGTSLTQIEELFDKKKSGKKDSKKKITNGENEDLILEKPKKIVIVPK